MRKNQKKLETIQNEEQLQQELNEQKIDQNSQQQNNPPSYSHPLNQPIYHAPLPKQGMSVGKIILVVVGTISVMIFGTCAVCTFIVGSASSNIDKERKEKDKKETELLVECSNNISVEWASIADDLKSNEAKVASEWKDNCAKVSGVVDRIDSGFDDKPYVVIDDGDKFSAHNLRCKPEDPQKALSLSKGQRVTVWGIGGDEFLGSLVLNHCTW